MFIPTGSISANALILGMALFIIKQLFADYIFQTTWMALGKDDQKTWFAPLLAHVSIHAIGTLIICLLLNAALFWLALVDFVVHGTIDRSKSWIQARYKLTATQGHFWWLLGTDQTLHHLTHLAFAIALAVTAVSST